MLLPARFNGSDIKVYLPRAVGNDDRPLQALVFHCPFTRTSATTFSHVSKSRLSSTTIIQSNKLQFYHLKPDQKTTNHFRALAVHSTFTCPSAAPAKPSIHHPPFAAELAALSSISYSPSTEHPSVQASEVMDLEMDPPFDYVTAHWRRMDVEILRMRNDFRDHEQAYKAYMAAQNQRQSMQTHLDKITALIDPGGGGGGVHLQTHLTALQEALTSQGSALEKMVKSIPPMARRPLGADELADKVFSIPELLERILLYLSTSDLLRVQRVDRQFSAAVQASPRIQMKMGLRQQEKCHIRFPIGPGDVYAFCFSSETYYCFTQQGRQRVGGNEVTVRVEVYTSEKTPLPKPGRRCRDVLICQPPIRALNVYTRCCAPQWPYRTSNGPSETIERENGVRFGDLLDAYLRIAEAHRLCPDADPELHDENGFVKPRISFEANVVALDDDPKLLDRQRYEKKRKTEEERWRASEVRMGPYIAAKRLARDNGQPIPTLAEFEKARDEAENETAPANLP